MKVFSSIIAWFRRYPIAAIAIIAIVAMSVFEPNFFTKLNLSGYGAQLSYVGICATGLAFLLIGAGMDLSLGTAISAISVISGLAMVGISNSALATSVGIVVIIAAGIAFSAVNGYFVAYVKVNAFMMTLITQFLFRGIALILTNSNSVTNLPEAFVIIGSYKLFGEIPISIFIMIAFFVVGQLILSKTSYGRKLFAVGANENAARLVGISTNGVLFKAYLFGGICNAVAAIILIGKLSVANPIMGDGLFLDIISAAVIGGCSLFGGKGSVIGAAFGVVLFGLVTNGLDLLGVSYQDQRWIKGLIILIAISINTLNETMSARKMLKSSSTEDKKAHGDYSLPE